MARGQDNGTTILLGLKDYKTWSNGRRVYLELHRWLLGREIDEEAQGFIQDADEIYLGTDEHSFRHQELVHSVTEVKQRKVL